MRVLCIFALAFALPFVTAKFGRPRIDNGGLNATEQIKHAGYPLEIHHVTTSDGYVLELHRIPHGINNTTTNSTEKPVVLFMHGILCTSGVYVIYGSQRSLPFILADRGYDVWLGNQRGTPFSLSHVDLDPEKDKAEYWNFTITELALLDLPATIDYALQITGESQLYYVGHSQGTMVSLILLSEKPEYNKKINIATLLAPVSYFADFPALVPRVLAEVCKNFQSVLNALGIYRIGAKLSTLIKIQETLPTLYEVVFYAGFGGADSKIFDRSLFPAIAAVVGGDVAVKVLAHYGQLIEFGKFAYYDYGLLGNIEAYGQSTPPDYKLENIVAPLLIFYSEHDLLVALEDAEHLLSQLSNVYSEKMSYDKYAHLDFLWSTTVNDDVNNKVLEFYELF